MRRIPMVEQVFHCSAAENQQATAMRRIAMIETSFPLLSNRRQTDNGDKDNINGRNKFSVTLGVLWRASGALFVL
jgi:hypothetical protein